MDSLDLIRVRSADTVFSQYIPQNLLALFEVADTVCVGALYRGTACGAAIAERTAKDEYHLRYIFIDPQARFCGLGTYLLRGLLGVLREAGAASVRAVYTHSMIASPDSQLGILQRAGFSSPAPVSTSFRTPLGDISCPDPAVSEGIELWDASHVPENIMREYLAMAEAGELPLFADHRNIPTLLSELSTFAAANGHFAGAFFIDANERDGEIRVAGIYVVPDRRGSRVAAAMISRTLAAAHRLLPPDTPVQASTINLDSFSLCEGLLGKSKSTEKETELLCVCTF